MKRHCLRFRNFLIVGLMGVGVNVHATGAVGNATTLPKSDGSVEINIDGNKETTVQFFSANALAIRADKILLVGGDIALKNLAVKVYAPQDPQARFRKSMAWQLAPGLFVPYIEDSENQIHLSEVSNLICRSVGAQQAKEIVFAPDHKGWTRRLALGQNEEWRSLIFTVKTSRSGQSVFYKATYETPASFLENYPGHQGVAVLKHLICQ